MKILRNISDPTLFWLAVAMSLTGLVAIYDAGFARSWSKGVFLPAEFRSQILFLFISVVVGLLVSRVPAQFWRKSAPCWFAFGFLALLLVKVIGKSQSGAQRWIAVGPIDVQPSEFVKVAVILFLAGVLSLRTDWKGPKRAPRDWAERLDRVWLPQLQRWMPALLVLLAGILIEREPDLGTAAVILGTGFMMYWFAGIRAKSLALVVVLGSVAVGGMVAAQPYRLERITNHQHRWDENQLDDIGYQTTQSEMAMADGGLTGVGLGAGRVKHLMPAATTDFIFATIAEESGFLGVAALLGLTGLFLWRLWWLGQHSRTAFGYYLCHGVAIWLTIQAVTNLMMANGTLPPIGIPFPFISSGGSSLLAVWIVVGLVQSSVGETAAVHAGGSLATGRNRGRDRWSRLPGA